MQIVKYTTGNSVWDEIIADDIAESEYYIMGGQSLLEVRTVIDDEGTGLQVFDTAGYDVHNVPPAQKTFIKSITVNKLATCKSGDLVYYIDLALAYLSVISKDADVISEIKEYMGLLELEEAEAVGEMLISVINA